MTQNIPCDCIILHFGSFQIPDITVHNAVSSSQASHELQLRTSTENVTSRQGYLKFILLCCIHCQQDYSPVCLVQL